MGLSAKNMADLIVGLCLRDVRGGAPTKTRRTTSWAGKREGRLPPAGSQTTLQLSWHLSLHSSRIDEQTITAVCCVNEESTRGQSCSLPPVVLSVSQANFVVNLPENCSLFKASPRLAPLEARDERSRRKCCCQRKSANRLRASIWGSNSSANTWASSRKRWNSCYVGHIDDLELERRECHGIWISFLHIFFIASGLRQGAASSRCSVSLSCCLCLGAN
jgi:hypothetical protein